MPTSYTSILKLSLPATGELSGSWGAEINNSITRLLETAVSGASNIVLADADYTLTSLNGTADDARAMFLYFTGTLTATRTVTVPAVSKMYVVMNNTARSLIFTNAGGASVTVTAGGSYLLRCSSLGVFAMGKVSGAELADAVAIASAAASASVHYPVLSPAASGTGALAVQSDKLSFVPSTGLLTVTGVAVSGSASGTGLDNYVNTRLASPPAIGGTSAGAGTFSNLSATASATVPTAAVDTNTTAAASTAFVLGQASAVSPAMDGAAATGTATRFARSDHVHPTDTSRAPVASPTFTGTVTVPTLSVGTAGTAPTLAVDTNTTGIATTAFVLAQASSTAPVIDGTATVGTSTRFARGDHVHPTDTSRAPTASPTFTGTVTLPATGAGANEAATKAYVDAVAVGLDTHTACKWATTAAITLATNGLTAVDGTVLTAGDRVLVKNQASSIENGIYVAAVGAWSRATDADAVGELKQGSYVFVQGGTVNQKTGWTQQTSGTITPGVSAILWTQFSSSSSYTGSGGITLTGSDFALTVPVTVARGGTGTTTSTGSGSVVLDTSPTLVTPILGTPTSGTLTNATGLPLTTGVTGTLAVTNGGTGGASAQLGMNNLAGAVTSGQYLRGNGTNVTMSAIQAADVPTLNQSTTGNATTATTATHIAGGAAGGIAYQTGVGATAINTPGTAGYVLVSGGAAAPSWSATSSLSIGSAAAVAVVDDNATATTVYPLWASATSGNVSPKVSSTKISLVPSTGALTATTFYGGLVGSVSGAVGASTLSASSTVSGAGFSTYLASPPAIGGTTSNTVRGTTVTATTQFSGPGTGLTGTASSLTAGAATSATNVYQTSEPTAGTYRLLFGNATNVAGAVYNKAAVYWNDTGSIIQGANISGNAATATNGIVSSGSYADPAWLTSLGWSKIASKPTTISGYGITDAITTGNIASQSVSSATNSTNATNLTGSGSISATSTATTQALGDISTKVATTAFVNANSVAPALHAPPVRQTVLSGPVDANGFSSFGGSTGSTTVTATATLKATAAAAGDANYSGSIVNPSWTGLSTNGTMYLYLSITSAGVVTVGSTTLAPVYQWGGTYSITNLQNTFNIQEMTMKVGNGATATQVYRVFVGEVTVAGAVVTAITWYALMGRYDSGFTATLPGVSTVVSKNHNIGLNDIAVPQLILECTTADAGFAVGDRISDVSTQPAGVLMPITKSWAKLTAQFATSSTAAFSAIPKTGGAFANLTAASWKYKLTTARSW